MSKKISTKLKEARRKYGPHNTLAVDIGISSDTLQRLILGAEPKQARIISLVNTYLDSKGL